MPNRIVVGTQWGDEGKAKIVDFLTNKSDIVVRFQGGANAGHTVVVKDKKFIFHLLPAGILYPDKICVIGNGVVLDAEEFFNEIESVKKEGIDVGGRLFVSSRAQVVMPFHRETDKLREKMKGKGKIGTTGRGIGPTYADKISRVGIRVADLFSSESLKEKIDAALSEKRILFKSSDFGASTDANELAERCAEIAKKLKPYVADTSVVLNDGIKSKKDLLFEGAQGTFLDIDHGTYPFVTSSNTIAGAACPGAGIGPTRINEVIGVVKAYTTRVGNGPFPTEFDEELGEKMRQLGGEFGATTGRPRRCGWLDAVMLKKSAELNGLDSVVITKLDVLDTIETIKIATAYKINGQETNVFPPTLDVLEKAKPVYEEWPGWMYPTHECTSYDALPENARKYLSRVQELSRAKLKLVSVGPNRSQTIEVG